MSMIKVISEGSGNFDEPRIQEVRLTRRGILDPVEKRAFEKRASVDILRDLDSLREKVGKDETLIHMLAVGATEDYGANRNGDGFRRETCKKYHPSFVKYARFYRNHINKDPKKSYGRLVKSAWHNPMKRIELLVALNSTDSAAKRNGGLVADREMEKLAQGKEIPVSMACKVAYDVCSYCGNQAPQTRDYCSGTHQGGMCKAGGLRDHLGALVEIDGGIHQLHADNPSPTFFDISNVFRPADRIAYVTGSLEKQAAASGRIVKSAELAEQMGITVPYELMVDGQHPKHIQQLVKIAYQLADKEADIIDGKLPVASVYLPNFDSDLRDTNALEVPKFFQQKFAYALKALADERVCLPLDRFIELVAGQPFEKAAEAAVLVSRELPGIYTRLLANGDLPERIKESHYAAAETAVPSAFVGWAQRLAPDMSLAPEYVERRSTRAALRLKEASALRPTLEREKVASDNSPISRMAEEYALYKLAFLGTVPETDHNLPLTANLVVLQNYAN